MPLQYLKSPPLASSPLPLSVVTLVFFNAILSYSIRLSPRLYTSHLHRSCLQSHLKEKDRQHEDNAEEQDKDRSYFQLPFPIDSGIIDVLYLSDSFANNLLMLMTASKTVRSSDTILNQISMLAVS
jgi:hypothetical protein